MGVRKFLKNLFGGSSKTKKDRFLESIGDAGTGFAPKARITGRRVPMEVTDFPAMEVTDFSGGPENEPGEIPEAWDKAPPWQVPIPGDKLQAFLRGEDWYDEFSSSNVARMKYAPDREELVIEFLSGGVYQYSGVNMDEAHNIATGATDGGSRGKAVWSYLRVRGPGNRFAYRKPYQLLSGYSTYSPKWMSSEELASAHGQLTPSGNIPGMTNKETEARLIPPSLTSAPSGATKGKHGLLGRVATKAPAEGLLDTPMERALKARQGPP